MKYFTFITFIIISCSSCFFSNDDCFRDYVFTLDFAITPVQDTFQIGDTIWISSTIPAELLDEESQEMVDVSDVDFPIICGAIQVDTTGNIPAELYFDYIVDQGDLLYRPVGNWIELYPQYDKREQEQFVRFGMIPKKKAVVMLFFFTLNDSLEEIQLSECTETKIIYYSTNGGDGAANNYYFIEGSENPWLQISLEAYEREGIYTFAIVE